MQVSAKPIGSVALTVFYRYGKDAPPTYQGVSLNEKFASSVSNLVKEWLKQTVVDKHPEWTNAQWVAHYFPHASENQTWTISAQHETDDFHSKFDNHLRLKPDLNDTGLTQTIGEGKPQTYECPAGTGVARWRIYRYVNFTQNACWMRKVRAP